MQLSQGIKNRDYIIKVIDQGKSVKLKLNSMGIYPDVTVKIVKNDGSGPLIIEVKKAKIILGRALAEKIKVEAV